MEGGLQHTGKYSFCVICCVGHCPVHFRVVIYFEPHLTIIICSEVNGIRFLTHSGHREAWEAATNPGSGKCGWTPGPRADLWSPGACAVSTVAPGVCPPHLLRSCIPSELQVEACAKVTTPPASSPASPQIQASVRWPAPVFPSLVLMLVVPVPCAHRHPTHSSGPPHIHLFFETCLDLFTNFYEHCVSLE